MGLQQNLNDIQTDLLNAKTAIAQSISNKGVECSADDKLSTFAEKIDSITTGSTGGTGNKIMLTNGTKFAYSTAFDPELYDTSNVTDMSDMFNNCSGLTGELDLSSWDVSSVTNMSDMFNLCSRLTNIDVSTWDVTNVTDMSFLFDNCESLTSIDVSTWDVTNAKTIYGMFGNCSGLTSIDLSNFKENNINNMDYMFSSCTGLTSIDLSNLNTNTVTKIASTFSNCKSLANLQLNDLGHNEDCTTLDVTPCPALTKDSIIYLFNNAFDRTGAGYTTAFTIKLNAKTKALLSEDEIAIATNKGFTVV